MIERKTITDYLEFLKSIGYTITLHGRIVNSCNFVQYNYHQNPYCHYIKTVYGLWNECICKQYKIIDKCEQGSFFGHCYAGVGEYIYPIRNKTKVIAFVSISGYCDKTSIDKAHHFAKKYNNSKKEIDYLIEKYLNKNIPSKETVDAVIKPLVYMLEEYYIRPRETLTNEKALYNKMLVLITEKFHSKITMRELSKELNYSVSSLSHIFMKNAGKSLPEYIDDLRLNEAKWHLSNGNASITEISEFLGYSSCSYFSNVFKKRCGVTPNKYRKNNTV